MKLRMNAISGRKEVRKCLVLVLLVLEMGLFGSIYIVNMEGYGAQAWVLSRPFCMDLMCLFDHEPSFWLDDDMYDSLLA